MTGYQQGIMAALGAQCGDRFAVRSINKWYPEQVQDVFGTTVHAQTLRDREVPQYVVKSARIRMPELSEVTDFRGFSRAWIEIHGILDLATRKNRDGSHPKVPRLRVYGQDDILNMIMHTLPVPTKRIQHIRNIVDVKYVGKTSAIYYQSPSQIVEILNYLYGLPYNKEIWDDWWATVLGSATS